MDEVLKLILSKLDNLEQGQKRIETRLDGIEDKLDGLQGDYQNSIQDLATHMDSKFNNLETNTKERFDKVDIELAIVKHKVNRTDDDVIGIKTRLEIVK